MYARHLYVVFALLMTLLLAFATWSLRAADSSATQGSDSGANVFDGKYLGFTMNNPLGRDHGGWLSKVQVRTIGNQSFLVGTWFDPESKKWDRMSCWVPVDKIDRILVCDNADEMKKLYDDEDEKK